MIFIHFQILTNILLKSYISLHLFVTRKTSCVNDVAYGILLHE